MLSFVRTLTLLQVGRRAAMTKLLRVGLAVMAVGTLTLMIRPMMELTKPTATVSSAYASMRPPTAQGVCVSLSLSFTFLNLFLRFAVCVRVSPPVRPLPSLSLSIRRWSR